MSSKLIFCLDIGSSKITAIVASVGENVKIHGVSSYYFMHNNQQNDYLCVTNGNICELDTVANRISQCLNEAQFNADCSNGGVIVNLAGAHLRTIYSKSRIELNNSPVTEDTIRKLINDALRYNLPSQYEILDYEVQEYLLDKENYTINPLNLICNEIETNINLFIGNNVQVANVKKAIKNSGFYLTKLIPSGILSGMSVLNYEEKELGCCLIDIGAGTTDVVVYENGFIRYLISLPIGGEQITKDIAMVLKISRNLAEDIKINYGACSYINTQHRENISIIDHRGISNIVSHKLLVDVITERLKELFELIIIQLTKQGIYDIISSGIVITGGTSLLPRINEFAEKIFEQQVKLGVPIYEGEFADLVTNPRYATSIGMLYFAKQYMLNNTKDYDLNTEKFGFKNLFKSMKNIFKSRG